MGLPELPDDTNNTLPTNNEVTMPVESDAEEDDNIYDGYQRLPLAPEDVQQNSDSDDSGVDQDNNLDEEYVDPLAIDSMETVLVQEVWKNSIPTDIEMNSEKVNEVKQAMLNFSLPASSIPDWANNIPEEQWKDQLLKKLQSK